VPPQPWQRVGVGAHHEAVPVIECRATGMAVGLGVGRGADGRTLEVGAVSGLVILESGSSGSAQPKGSRVQVATSVTMNITRPRRSWCGQLT
jgi:hypothetical protein